ncbi:MAG: hypothetical protein V1660_04860 [archaeon]
MAGIIKGLISFLVISLSLFLLSSFIFSFSFANSISEEVLKPSLTQLFLASMNGEADLSSQYTELEQICDGKEEINLPLSKSGDDFLQINCKELKTAGKGGINKFISESMFEKLYYTEYECVFFDCFKNSFNSSFLFSKKCQDVTLKLSYILLAVLILLLLFFSPLLKIRKISWIFLLNGLSSLGFFVKPKILSNLSKTQFSGLDLFVSSFLDYFFILCCISLGVGLILLIISKILQKKLPEIKQKTKQKTRKKR